MQGLTRGGSPPAVLRSTCRRRQASLGSPWTNAGQSAQAGSRGVARCAEPGSCHGSTWREVQWRGGKGAGLSAEGFGQKGDRVTSGSDRKVGFGDLVVWESDIQVDK